MTVRFSGAQLQLLQQALDAAARPFDFGEPEQWREEVLRRTLTLFGSKAGHLDIFGIGLEREACFVGYSDEISRAWNVYWRNSDAVVERDHTEELPLYTRQYRYGLLGSEWEQRYRRSPVFQEFYVPYGLDVDAAGLHVTQANHRIHLHVDFTGSWSAGDDTRARALMGLIRPVLSASVGAIEQRSAQPFTAAALFDALDTPVAVIDERGKWIHCSSALTSMLREQDAAHSQAWRLRVTEVARYHLRRVESNKDNMMLRQRSPALPHLGSARVSLVTFGGSDTSPTRVVLVRVNSSPAPGTPPTASKADGTRETAQEIPRECPVALAHLALTDRQWAVARLIAAGYRNQDIADALGISVFTTRRHVETVLMKCGVSSRAAVATVLWRCMR